MLLIHSSPASHHRLPMTINHRSGERERRKMWKGNFLKARVKKFVSFRRHRTLLRSYGLAPGPRQVVFSFVALELPKIFARQIACCFLPAVTGWCFNTASAGTSHAFEQTTKLKFESVSLSARAIFPHTSSSRCIHLSREETQPAAR